MISSQEKSIAHDKENLILSKKTIFRILFFGTLLGFGSLIFVHGIYGLVTDSSSIITIDNKPIGGVLGFLALLIFIPVFSIFWSGTTWLAVCLGLWLHRFYKPFKLEFTETDKEIK